MSTTKRRTPGEGSIKLRKDGRWEGRLELGWTDSGRQRRTVYGTTKQECATKLREAIANHEKGLPAPKGRLTVGAYLEGWLEGLQVRPSTAARYRGLLRQHAIPALEKTKLTALTPQRVETLLAERLASGLSPRTVHHLRAVLRTALQKAVKQGDLVRNPAALADPVRVEQHDVTPMTPRDARAILDAVAGTEIEAPVAISLWTGLRQGELLGLRWDDIDLPARTLRVERILQRLQGTTRIEHPKTKKSRRVIALPAPALEALTAHKQRQRERQLAASKWSTAYGDLVFTDEAGNPLYGTNLTRAFKNALRSAGLTPIRWHDMRHATATLMLAAGTDLKVVSEVLGHSTIATTANVYAGVLDTLKVDAADRMAQFVNRR